MDADNGAMVSVNKSPMLIGSRGIQITTHDELWRFAQAVCKTEFVPPSFRNDAGSTMVALEYAMELGLPMLQGLQNIMVVNGRPSIWGDLGLAMIESSGLMEDFFEDFEGTPFEDSYKAICISKRKSRSRPTITEFSVLDAKVAKLWGKSGPWSTNPKRMLQMRARWFNHRDGYADVLRGLYSREEMEDSLMLERTPEGYELPKEAQLPPAITTQLAPPPQHPTLAQIKELQELMGAVLPKEQHSLELRKYISRLAEGYLTQKYLQSELTIDEWETLTAIFRAQLQTRVEQDVPKPPPPQEESPETPLEPLIPYPYTDGGEADQDHLRTIAWQVDDTAKLDVEQTISRLGGKPMLKAQYETMRDYLIKRLNLSGGISHG